MNLLNTNRLRVTVSDARKFHLATGLGRYYSDDHGLGREANWDFVIGRFWLHVKWRPNGKHDLSLYGKGTPQPLSVLRASYEKLMGRR
jgi:hypothetical protein